MAVNSMDFAYGDAYPSYLQATTETTTILKDDGYEKVYKYVEIDWNFILQS